MKFKEFNLQYKLDAAGHLTYSIVGLSSNAPKFKLDKSQHISQNTIHNAGMQRILQIFIYGNIKRTKF